MRDSIKRSLTQALGGIAAAALVATVAFFPPPFFKVQEIAIVTPLKRVSERDLMRLSQVKKGDNLILLSLKQVRENLLRYPWIREVQLSKRLPGRLMIWVKEEDPIALLELDSLYFVNREGIVFKKMEKGDPQDLPTITGLSKEEVGKKLEPLIKIVRFFEETKSLASVGLSEIHWKKKGDISLITKEPAIRVELGRDSWNEKLDRLARAWPTIHRTSVDAKVIDLNLKRRIIVTKK